ncbi:MAG: anti-phage ZorAB system protein ZorA [Candidatus Poribacteria bacterium]|nr:anti-phage ZorAB system protein ZorA [Candidatus Poribacteria bacterium]
MNEFLTLLLPWKETPNDQISDYFVYGIFALFSILLVIFLWKTIRRIRLISGLNKKIDKLGSEYGRPADPGILNELEEIFNRSDKFFRPFNKAWQEFKESLITPERRKVVYKTDEASLFFSEERLIGQYMNLRFWNSVPAILVGLGILGTFVGLVWGLGPFSNINFEQTSEIQEAIKILLSGVSTAFVTSVWGMLVSLLFNWLEKGGIGMVSRKIANLQGALDLPFTLKTQEEIAEKQKDELEQQTAVLKSLFTDFGNDIKSAMREGRQEILSELNKTVEAFSTTILEQLRPILEKLMEAIEELRQQKEESSAEAIKELIEKFQESLSASTVTQMEELAKTVGEASQSLKDLPNQIGMMIASIQEQINQTHQLLAETSQEQTDQMKNMLEGMINTLQSVVDLAAKQTGEQLDLQMENMKTVSQESIQTLQTTITELRHSMTETLKEQQDAIDKITSQTSQASVDATDKISQLMDQITSRLSETVQDAEKSIETLLQQQNEQTKAFNAQITNSMETFESGQKMLAEMESSVSSVRQIIEKTQALSGQLTMGADQLESAGRQLMQASTVFNQENEKYLTENRETIQQLENLHGQTLQLIDNSTQRFQTIDEGLQSIFSEIEKGLNTYAVSSRETINTYLIAFSDQFTQAVAALSSSIEALEDNFEDLNDRIERLIRR